MELGEAVSLGDTTGTAVPAQRKPTGTAAYGRALKGLLAGTAMAAVAACTDEQMPEPNEEDAARFLAQAGLGATTRGCADVVRLGYGAWIDAQFAMPLSTSLWDWMIEKGFNDTRYRSLDTGLDNAMWFRLFNAPDVLRQRVVLALSQIFVVSIRNMPVAWAPFTCVAYWEMLEAQCFGNFRTLLENVALSPAMGVYLSMRGSRKEDISGRRPDENFARELLQLFTIGLVELNQDGSPRLDGAGQPIDTYSNDDIQGLARVFTGWDLDRFDEASPDYGRRPMAFKQADHSVLDKRFLGTTIMGTTPGKEAMRRALDAIFAHPNVAPFFARRLIQRLTTSNPSPAYIARVAQVFNDDGHGVRGDMKAVIKAVLMDAEARLGEPFVAPDTAGKLREPILRLLQWARVVKLNCSDGLWGAGDLSTVDKLGQSPMRSPSVFNFYRPGYVPPQSAIAQRGMVAPEFQITDESSVIGYANFLFQVLPAGGGNITPDYSDWIALAKDPAALVDRINLLFTGRGLSAQLVADLTAAVATQSLSDADGAKNRVVSAMLIVLCSPEFLVQR
jgi:uncharacterized protein (DUF1800 family)